MKYKDGTAYSDWFILQSYRFLPGSNEIMFESIQLRKRKLDLKLTHYPLWFDPVDYTFTCTITWTYSDRLWKFVSDNVGCQIYISHARHYTTLKDKKGSVVRLKHNIKERSK
jgi:hypothetical protein